MTGRHLCVLPERAFFCDTWLSVHRYIAAGKMYVCVCTYFHINIHVDIDSAILCTK